MPTLLEYAQLTDPDEADALRGVLAQTLYFPDSYWPTLVRRVGPENLRVVRRDGRVAGGLAIYRMGQWFGGRCVPMAGIAAVGVAPEQRAIGAAGHLMASTLKELHEDEIPLSVLYASTQRLYRKVGYEQGGSSYSYELLLSSIGLMERSVPIHQVTTVTDHEVFHDLARDRAKRTNGNLERNEGLWERIVTLSDKTTYAYLIGRQDRPEGFVVFYQNSKDPGSYDLFVRDMVAITPAAVRSLWTFFSDHRSIAQSVSWHGPANEPLLNLPAELGFKVTRAIRWLLRIVDVKKALSQRGYPQGIEGELHLEIEDGLLPANHGRFVLTVSDGQAEVHEGGRGELRTDIRGLAPLYTGLFTPGELRTTGQLEADDQSLCLAAQLFAGTEPWMPDAF